MAYTISDMQLVQIVPGLPPQIDGIGDYALQMARSFRQEHGIETHFLVCDDRWKSDSADGKVQGFAATRISKRTSADWLLTVKRIEQETAATPLQLLVHFSPYSYQLRGCPFWLVHALERRHAEHPGTLHVAMHELEDNSNKPWKSNFWLPGIQRGLLRRVAHLANYRYTNSEFSRGRLEEWGTGRFDLIMNFSTMCEPRVCPLPEERERVIVVFGRRDHRRLTYQRGSTALAALCHALKATRIVDIGPPIPDHIVPAVAGIPIERCGRLSSEDVVLRMGRAIGSFIYYSIPKLTKSSIYAVSCSAGTMPYVFDDDALERSCGGLITGEDLVPISRSLNVQPPADVAASSQKVFDNYQKRNSRAASLQVARQLRSRICGTQVEHVLQPLQGLNDE